MYVEMQKQPFVAMTITVYKQDARFLMLVFSCPLQT